MKQHTIQLAEFTGRLGGDDHAIYKQKYQSDMV